MDCLRRRLCLVCPPSRSGPEIYFTVNADQWTNIRHVWGDSYSFFGTTGTVGIPGQLTPEAGWSALNARNPGNVSPELLCFC